MFKNVVPENEFTRITQSMNSGEEVHYALILANVHKKGLSGGTPVASFMVWGEAV